MSHELEIVRDRVEVRKENVKSFSLLDVIKKNIKVTVEIGADESGDVKLSVNNSLAIGKVFNEASELFKSKNR